MIILEKKRKIANVISILLTAVLIVFSKLPFIQNENFYTIFRGFYVIIYMPIISIITNSMIIKFPRYRIIPTILNIVFFLFVCFVCCCELTTIGFSMPWFFGQHIYPGIGFIGMQIVSGLLITINIIQQNIVIKIVNIRKNEEIK